MSIHVTSLSRITMNTKHLMAGSMILFALLAARRSDAQSVFSEDFTGTATTNSWYFFRGACLTASSASPGANPSTTLPGCTASSVIQQYYNNETQLGGTTGTLPDKAITVGGVSTQTGALRFTNANGTAKNNGLLYGSNEGGAIISAAPFNTSNGVQITFKTVTYGGNSGSILGGSVVGDGADGISFFMIDGSVAPSTGSEGGSLAYTCSNPGNLNGHPVIDGITGAYVGLGIDEYGNFLNASDNTATGFGPQGNRIGLRGAGNVSWSYLNTNYSQYYPSSLTAGEGGQQQQAVAATCQSGFLWDYSNPANPAPVLTGGSTVTGSVSGVVARNSFTVTGIPTPLPQSLIEGATITGNNIPVNTTITNIGTNSITLSNAASSGAARNGSAETLQYSSTNPGQNVDILDYQAIPNGSATLTGVNIAQESATTRGAATPIFYNLKITANGLLSLSYSLSGAGFLPIITNQLITSFSGTMPKSLLFGFAGSTGGATNIHEIMCFKAQPQNTSGSSATANEKQSAKVQTTSQAFFAFYDPNVWTGTVTANPLNDAAGVVTVGTTAIWDAGCVLTGTPTGNPTQGGGCVTTGVSGPTSATPTPAGRVMLTWDTTNNVGIPFELSGTNGIINTLQENNLDALDSTPDTATRLNFLRGSRGNEVTPTGVGLYRPRTSILGDIVDSSPTWVGPPILGYPATWTDRLQTSDSMVENSGTQTYPQYTTAEISRLNVVYVGANDGFLHGFQAGSTDLNGNLTNNSATPNNGQEVLAYMPGSTLLSSVNTGTTSTNCTNHAQTQSQVQNIHGVTPAIGTGTSASPLCVDPTLDVANPQYGHNFFVDATPATGDLFYGGVWHSWVVGGLGAGGAAIFALDVTTPGNFAEKNAKSLVLGEWNPTSITTIGCASTSSPSKATSCGSNLGNTYGTPQIRRLHNGQWGVIFGNGFGSSTGDAGIYVMTVDSVSSTGKLTPTFYYLSTGQAGGNGIAYTTPVDLDGDHITDYVYAGDLQGNVWRFDLTSTNPANWVVSPGPLFTTLTGQPITTQLLAISSTATGSPQKLMIEFATGARTQVTNVLPESFASGTQAIYGIWDWNMSAWNAISGTQYASLTANATATGLSSPFTIPTPSTTTTAAASRLTQQTFTVNTSTTASAGIIDGTNVAVCWQGGTVCGATGNNKFGWYANLIGGVTSPSGLTEQVIFNPVFFQGAILVDSIVPANNIPTSCSAVLDAGFTYILNATNGGVFNDAFPTFAPTTGNFIGTPANDPVAAGVETNATGSVYVVNTMEGKANIIFQTVSGTPSSQQINVPANTQSKRLTWVEHR
jgi:type IV pilus assembly protein PilY1